MVSKVGGLDFVLLASVDTDCTEDATELLEGRAAGVGGAPDVGVMY